MRTYFVIDPGCRVEPNILRELLGLLWVSHRRYEILVLDKTKVTLSRTWVEGLRLWADKEAEATLKQYEDASRCVVIVGAEVQTPERPGIFVPMDYVFVLQRDGSWIFKTINPPALNNRYWVSSKETRPQLVEAAIEFAGIETVWQPS